MNIFICSVCGHIEFGRAPDECPVCEAKKESFKRDDNIFTESTRKSPEAAVKHIPSITVKQECGMVPETKCTDILVRIGETLHPMEDKHFIQFIDCYIDDKYVARACLTPDVNPAIIFHLREEGRKVRIVENCNIHGYWHAEAEIGMARRAGVAA